MLYEVITDPQVKKVQEAFYDPFEYLWLRHRGGALKTDFPRALRNNFV